MRVYPIAQVPMQHKPQSTCLKSRIFALIYLAVQLSTGCSDAGHDDINEGDEPLPQQASLDPNLKLTSLTAAQIAELCLWTGMASPSRAVTCDDGSTVIERGNSAASCRIQLEDLLKRCQATVADHEQCILLTDCQAEDRSDYCARIEACLPQ